MSLKKFKITLLVLVVFVFSVSLNAEITRNDARNIVVSQIVGNEIENVNIFQESNIYSDSTYELNPYKSLSVPYSSCWIFFIDDNPLANWEHECRYVFVNNETGTYSIVNEKVPPLDYKTKLEEVSINIPIETIEYQFENQQPLETREPDPHKYAILLSGETEPRHWNDLSAMYCALKYVYGYTDENMIVLSHNGQQSNSHNISLNLDNDQEELDDIDGACTYENVDDAFQLMANQLNSDDMLFVYVNDHGGTHGNNASFICLYQWAHLEDVDFAAMVAPINCSEIIYVMEQCESGGFQDNLEGEHVTFYSATDGSHSSWGGTGVASDFDEFVYYWTSAVRGYFPFSSQQPWVNSNFVVGENPYLAYDFNPDDIDHGGNGDGIVQMGEAFRYADYMDLYSSYGECNYEIEYPQDYDNTGFIVEDLLTLSGITGNVIASQTVNGNFLINGDLIINPGVTVNLYDGSFNLTGKSLLKLNNSSLIIHDGCSITGSEPVTWYDPATGNTTTYSTNAGAEERIPCDRIEVTGENSYLDLAGTEANPITISSTSDYNWEGIKFIDSDPNDEDPNNKIHYCNVSGIDKIYSSNSTLLVEESDCNNTSFEFHNSEGYILLNSIVGSVTSYESPLQIGQSYIRNGSGTGLSFMYPADHLSIVQDCTIENNNGRGINCYNQMVRVIGSTIKNNSSFGFVSMNGANTAINESQINDNGASEIPANYDAFPILHYEYAGHTYYGYNTISDNEYTSNNYDKFLLFCIDYENPPIDCRRNIINHSESERFFPSVNAYLWDGQLTPDKELFYEGLSHVYNHEFEQAGAMMKSIVSDYPETKTAAEAINVLAYIEKFGEKNFSELRDYLETINEDLYPHLNMAKYKALTSTYMGEKDYETAINRLEEIINNPPSEVDSLFSFIDEGYCYLKTVENGDKNIPAECTFKPKSIVEFKRISRELEQKILGINSSSDNNNQMENHPVNAPILIGNYPNPFNPQTTISFSLLSDSKVNIRIYNIKGQKINTIANKEYLKGSHSIVWKGKDDKGKAVSSGVYFYKLSVNGKSEQIKKCLLLK